MIRIYLEVLSLFLLPTAVYVAFKFATLRPGRTAGMVIAQAPVMVLSILGLGLVVGVLTLFGTEGDGRPGQTYEPAHVRDGQLIPGRMK